MTAVVDWSNFLCFFINENSRSDSDCTQVSSFKSQVSSKSQLRSLVTCYLLLVTVVRSEPSSRTTLIGEQPNLWELLHPQDVVSRHRGAELRRRYERLGGTSLLSLE